LRDLARLRKSVKHDRGSWTPQGRNKHLLSKLDKSGNGKVYMVDFVTYFNSTMPKDEYRFMTEMEAFEEAGDQDRRDRGLEPIKRGSYARDKLKLDQAKKIVTDAAGKERDEWKRRREEEEARLAERAQRAALRNKEKEKSWTDYEAKYEQQIAKLGKVNKEPSPSPVKEKVTFGGGSPDVEIKRTMLEVQSKRPKDEKKSYAEERKRIFSYMK